MVMPQSPKNIVWHGNSVTVADREQHNGHGGAVLWFTGLSGSGKSTIAVEVEKLLFAAGVQVYILDGDNIRHGLNANLGFSAEDRKENIRRVGEVACLFADAGMIVLSAFISPYQEDRDRIRHLVGNERFVEVYIDADVETCKKRDPKGLYVKAIKGEIKDFTGISAPYEKPLQPEITVATAEYDVPVSAAKIIAYLKDKKIIS